MWGQPPQLALSEVEGAVRSSKLDGAVCLSHSIARQCCSLNFSDDFFAPFANPPRALRFRIFDRKAREEKPRSPQSRGRSRF
ncbi:hypothetical protein SBA1_680031 [Candidatus Sulfotelmatobacter kueseliae]|uniref:Uncharacterized protein n=1 Tax=Candidatus Sulfotelmatobacter kueseliae TaxID=2042962 RepID=A0A2U3L4H6_9BACT|nr:hypothetical protein SBA1_680031 [Candidatus Sulfotelmatobacter kueseliae]